MEGFLTISGRSVNSPIEALNDDLSTIMERHFREFIANIEESTEAIDWNAKRLEAKLIRDITTAEIKHYIQSIIINIDKSKAEMSAGRWKKD